MYLSLHQLLVPLNQFSLVIIGSTYRWRCSHALYTQEIPLNIFGDCSLSESRYRYRTDLAALGRTCRTFKEPALVPGYTYFGQNHSLFSSGA
jgi:hypothetical protein